MSRAFLLTVITVIISETVSNPGMNFILSVPDNKYKSMSDSIILYISTTVENSVNVTITAPTFTTFNINSTFVISSTSPKTFTIDERFRMPAGTGISPRALVIQSSDYIQVICADQYSSNADSFLAIPDPLLGKEYVIVSAEPHEAPWASFLTVTTGNGSAEVDIVFPNWPEGYSVVINETSYTGGETAFVRLNEFETFQIESSTDLTGAFVRSSRQVAVYAGVNRTIVNDGRCLSRMLDQMPPMNRLGVIYVTVPFPKRDAVDLYRIVATEGLTSVSIAGEPPIVLQKRGDYKEITIPHTTYYFIHSTKPVAVGQLCTSSKSGANQYGDPCLVMLTPMEGAYADTYFARSSYSPSYVTIVIDAQDISGVLFDGSPLGESQVWYPVTGSLDYKATQVSINGKDDLHNVAHSNGTKFVAYFHTAVSCEAQGFALGISQEEINAPCVKSHDVPGDGVDNDCDGSIDEELCCRNVDSADEDGDGLFDEDCRGLNGTNTTDIIGICCDSSDQQYACTASSVSLLFRRIENRKSNATLIEEHHVTRGICAHLCSKNINCWGINYLWTQQEREVTNCELLSGMEGNQDWFTWWSYWEAFNRTSSWDIYTGK